jgi:nucleoside phosphorylase
MRFVKILITFAVDAEFAPWRKRRVFVKSIVKTKFPYVDAAYPVYAVSMGSIELHVALTGMGYYVARDAIRALLESWPPDVCISSGLAGATRPEHKIGEVLVAESVRPLLSQRFKNSDSRLLHLACASGAKRVGAFLSSKHFVKDSSEKHTLKDFVDAVEMESFRIMCAALGRGIPAVAIRVVSDSYDQDLPYDFHRFVDDRGRPSVPKALRQLTRHPAGLRKLSAVVRQANKSAGILAEFFERLIPALESERDAIMARSEALAGRT